MAEAIVSAILPELAAIAIQNAREEWRLVTGVEKEVERLKSNLKAIQCELEDAEEKQFVNKRVQYWLDRFKQVSYDIEDVLDDWKTALHKLQTDGVETSSVKRRKVWPLSSYFSFGTQVARRHDIATRIKEINEELDEIAKDRVRIELIKSEIKQPNRSESTSFVHVSQILGRDEIKEKIISKLLSGPSEEGGCNNIPTITVVGMGGMGKTALSQLIYNDHRIQTHFENKIWVCVSDPFDQRQIAREILGGLNSGSTNLQNPISLESLLNEIREKIEGKKFFFVLDDVWSDRDQDWEPLKAAFQYGMPGSWILVTTRKESVARQMDLSHVFPLKQLPDEMCWSIIAQIAFTGENSDRRGNLEDIGREIAKKCKGLPLAAKTLGDLLRDKQRREEWQNVLSSEIWKSDFAQDIFQPLLLSYYDLPSTIRRCLLYCAIFQKDYRIRKDELIQRWMAQGYLTSADNFGRELEGEGYFKFLAARSFFQDFDNDADGNIRSCKMHDMVHEFVQFLTKYEFVTEKDVHLTLDLSYKKPRHLRLVAGPKGFPMSINSTEKLRSLVVVSLPDNGITNEALQNLFSQSKRLRLLELRLLLQGAEGICCEIGKLIHLRYLCLIDCTDIKYLPEALCELRNLQSLIIRFCPLLKKLPVGIGNLINLRYLSIERCRSVTYYPKGIGKLTSLMRLNRIIVRADRNDAEELSIGDLQHLDLLAGKIYVELEGDAIDGDEAKRAKLHNKIHLKQMYISISPGIKEDEVVQALNPPSNLSVEIVDNQEDWIFRTIIVPLQSGQLGRLKTVISGSSEETAC
ncbi:Cc-nbs-lrr resistance protein, putative isoform 2 [Theobroma cacao]|uniref:Cc-nbs-lrr resistance protein, putative isoform 2 n=1 Tax=Theobroma cacao TaxID=3641 RepID=A0A061F1A6_THECC|nr:Cc-nbs-lrr resistance protein, putative isoform 2 [Theobroma cacao]EOY10836.1 Cc-nbs-lrr resistance protein, putative isoform 2 [Theobroma cacao]